jgi:hypothetical protein
MSSTNNPDNRYRILDTNLKYTELVSDVDKEDFNTENPESINNVDGEMTASLGQGKEKDASVFKKYLKTSLKILFCFLSDNVYVIFATIFYLITLKGCYYSQDECVLIFEDNFVEFIVGVLIISSSMLYFINFILVINKKRKLYTLFFEISVILFLCFIYDTGTSMESHGGYNRIILFLFFYIYGVVYALTKILIFLFKKSKIYTILGLTSLILISVIWISVEFKDSCKGWEDGFKNTRIDNKLPCKIESPSVCYETIVNNLFDVSFYFGDTCQKIGNNRKGVLIQYNKKLNDSVKKIGYPRVESWSFNPKSLYSNYKMEVVRELIDMDDESIPSEVKKNIEVTVDFEKKEPIVEINVIKQEQKAKDRLEIYNNLIQSDKTKPIFKNIFFLFVDSVSRNHFKRKLPKLYGWVENFYKSKENSKYESFQFLKYHGTATWTNGNLMPAFFGVPFDETRGGTYILKYFKEKGYMTGSFTNQCSREFVDLHGGSMTYALKWTSYDHEFSSLFCDPNFTPPDNPFPILNGPYGVRRKCLYSKPTLEYAIDYTTQFMNMYKDQPKYFRLGTINGHEGTGEVIKYDDDLLFDFMSNFEKNGFMDETLTVVFSDHSYTMPGFHNIFQTPDHMKELTLPFLSFILPKNHPNFEFFKKTLRDNENMFTTPYDLHNTLIGFLNDKNIDYNNKGKNIFYEKFSGKETCKHFKIKSDWCKCSHEYDKRFAKGHK